MFRIKPVEDRKWDYRLFGTSDEEDPLDGGIDKWKTLFGFLTENPDATVHDSGRNTCSLCTLYWGRGCKSCIVNENSEDTQCRGTPYDDWEEYGDLQSATGMLEFLIGLKESG